MAMELYAVSQLRRNAVPNIDPLNNTPANRWLVASPARRSWETAYSSITGDRASQPVVLIHPALPNAASGLNQKAFKQSVAFFNSTNRQKEWASAQKL